MGYLIRSGRVVVENNYIYLDHAFDKYYIAYKEGQGLGVIDKYDKNYINFEYNILSRIGDKNLLTGGNMETDETTIFSSDMEKLVTMKDASTAIYDNYVEIYNGQERVYIDNEGNIVNAKEILKDNKLYAVQNSKKKWGFENSNGEIKVECVYDFATELNEYGFAAVRDGNLWKVINSNGELLQDVSYDFGEDSEPPSFLGKYYKTYKENNEIYYTDYVEE